jgi:hypothetical protein
MRASRVFVSLWFFIIAFNALAKDADSFGGSKNTIDSGKRERRHPAPENIARSVDWQLFLGWHRDATLSGTPSENLGGANRPFIQL